MHQTLKRAAALVLDHQLRASIERYAEANGMSFNEAVNALAADAADMTRRELLERLQGKDERIRH